MQEEQTQNEDERDVVFEDIDESTNPQALIKKLREKLKTTETDKQEYLTGWQKAKADFINLRKKDEEMKGEVVKFAKEDLIVQIIPVLDSFQLAFGNKEHWESVSKDWRIGVESIYNQLVSVLNQNGVTQQNPIHEVFDPKYMEAVGVIEVEDESKNNTVVEVLQLGYSLNGKEIRSAKVKIGEKK